MASHLRCCRPDDQEQWNVMIGHLGNGNQVLIQFVDIFIGVGRKLVVMRYIKVLNHFVINFPSRSTLFVTRRWHPAVAPQPDRQGISGLHRRLFTDHP